MMSNSHEVVIEINVGTVRAAIELLRTKEKRILKQIRRMESTEENREKATRLARESADLDFQARELERALEKAKIA